MLTMTDMFCGAGGSSTGAHQVPGITTRVAANHWRLAVDTHNTNHPDTDHDCADISQVNPHRWPRTNILWASPECTNHSAAKGRVRNVDATPDLFGEVLPDEAADRSRATMWDVPRFAEVHHYDAIIVENVIDAAKWIMFPAWLEAMHLLGYLHQTVYLNSMHASALGTPAPQSRDRMYVVCWKKANHAPDLAAWTRPQAWCTQCDRLVRAAQGWKTGAVWGRYGAQYLWRCPRTQCRNSVVEPGWVPAAAAINWDLPSQRIGDRARPLAEKTMARIRDGLTKLVAAAQLVPVEGRPGKPAAPATAPMRTQTTRNETGVLIPLRNHNAAKTTDMPLDTIAANGNHHALLDYNGTARRATWPMPTQTTVQGDALLSLESTIAECTFRMLEPSEIAAGQAFPTEYRILGNKRAQVRQIGNAVTPPAARDLLGAVAESLA